ncbi:MULTISPECIES: TetR/AcrR family transcriptional regulator [Kitasatospora]|uniref:Putative TetR family transcriptional regulator n=1 Tax=Kitasatospora setae (strain ATCC 33774 / DSM 43861 / JCM 3304 / KCC A-0304 / NBRC 14216 / KM-6054) TaxID=452652 RepID=E4NBB1_KITSK|nr:MULTISPECIES: TetR/AcrR family transcriptional regulator [Kitasatospora]BAJ28492.1 putative TetR family transcriptional regulator [Kitasatospora setae KM-6054]
MPNRATAPALPRRDQIRKEAARLFAARGFLGVGVDEIGKAVGISGPGLYRHFAGKDAMLADLLVGISERLLEEGRRREGEAAGPRAALDSLIDGHIDFALDDRDLITLHDRELLHLKEADRRRVRRLQRGYVELWVAVVREAFPPLAAPEAEPVARAAVHAVFGLLNSTPHSAARQQAQAQAQADAGSERSGLARDHMAALLRALAQGAFVAAAAAAGGIEAAGGAGRVEGAAEAVEAGGVEGAGEPGGVGDL